MHAPTSSAQSRSGAISVVTTPLGLPLRVQIDRSQLVKSPQVLAAEIFALCRQSAVAAGISMRTELAAAGVPADVIDTMGLPRPDDLARLEFDADQGDGAPASWLRSV